MRSPTGYCNGAGAVGEAGPVGQHLLHQAPGHCLLFFPLVVSVWIKKYKKMQKGYGLFFCQAVLFFFKG